ncbi:MAG TPA: hypothetical protein VJ901_09175 [Thermoanaerobaculia bacterium]|nr:hypothetical protein [Thermoanaerobaculia bacterium]
MLAIGDRTIDVASSTERDVRDPSVAAGGDVILVVWRDLPRALSFWLFVPDYRVYARRFAHDGTALDAQPILLEAAGSDYVEIELGTATAFDGRNFVAFWGGSSFAGERQQLPVHVLRISPTGTLVDSSAMLIAGVKNFGYNSGFRVVNTGGELLVAWSTWDDYRYIRGISPPPSPVTAIEVVRLDTRSTSMSVIDERELWSDADLSKQVGLAWNGSNALLASVRRGCVLATLLDAKLATVAEKTKVECGSNEHPAVAWNGGEFAVAWSADAVHAIRFDRALQPLDDAPFAVGPPGIASHEPSLAASASGVAITYEHLDDEVPRLFTRELDSLGRTPRRASASRTSQ